MGLLLSLFLFSACGEKKQESPPKTPVPVTAATDAVFNESDTAGVLLWKVSAESLLRESEVIRCAKLELQMMAREVDGRKQDGMHATAPSGTIKPGAGKDSGAAVELEEGFTLETDDGWHATGGFALWNGEEMIIKDDILLTRGETRVEGQSGVIIPSRKIIRIRKASGSAGEVAF